MSPSVARHGKLWIVSDESQLDGRTIESYWSAKGWSQSKEGAETFETEVAATARAAELPPVEFKPVVSESTIAVKWDDSHRLSALLSRAEDLIARGRLSDEVQAQALIRAVRSDDPHRAELGQRLRDLCDLAEAGSLAEGMFLQLMQLAPSERAKFLRDMVGSQPPTFEEEWLDFKSGIHGHPAKPAPLSDDTLKELWSTALAGFANTGGGVLIWGIDARPTPTAGSGKKVDAASDLRLVPHPDGLKSDLMRLHHTATDPPVAGVRVEPFTDQAGGGFVVCLIPESRNKPHRAEFVTNKPHYIRFGDDFVVMSQAVLRSMFFPQANPQYSVLIRCRGRNLQNPAVGTFDFFVTIRNVGNATAREPFVVLQVSPYGAAAPSVNHRLGWQHVHVENGTGLLGGTSIHPGATAPTIRADFPKLSEAAENRVIVNCVIHSLDAEPKRFSTAFSLTEILAGNDLVNDASELPS